MCPRSILPLAFLLLCLIEQTSSSELAPTQQIRYKARVGTEDFVRDFLNRIGFLFHLIDVDAALELSPLSIDEILDSEDTP